MAVAVVTTPPAEKLLALDRAAQDLLFRAARTANAFTDEPVDDDHGFDAAGVEREFHPDGRHRVLLLMNIGRPAEGAWRWRLPRLDYPEVVRTL